MTALDAVLSADTPVIYEGYKEPLKKVRKGYGYMGTLAMNAERTHLQCHICGLLFKSLGIHVRVHKLTGREYRDKFGLAVSTSLVSEEGRLNKIKHTEHLPQKGEQPVWLKDYVDGLRTGRIAQKGHSWSLEKRNKEGLCPDQVLEKIKELAVILGRTPSNDEFKAHYQHKFHGSLIFQWGSWNKAVKAAGMTPVGVQRQLDTSPEKLIKELKDFYKRYKRIPMTSDWKRGLLLPRYHYHKHFGTLNSARVAAGMNAIIPLPRHMWMEIPAKDWKSYEERINTVPLTIRKKDANHAWWERVKKEREKSR